MTVFIARDHHFTDKKFANVVENEKILVNVIGIRFELNDPYICAIAKLTEPKSSKNEKEKPVGKKLSILD